MRHWITDRNIKLASFCGAATGYMMVAFASWLPPAFRPDLVMMSDKVEHALAYLFLGALSAIATRQIVDPRWIGLTLIVYAGVLELGQLLIPGRTASATDFAVSAAAGILGVWLTTLTMKRLLSRLAPGRVVQVADQFADRQPVQSGDDYRT